jgi:hypothetical protein
MKACRSPKAQMKSTLCHLLDSLSHLLVVAQDCSSGIRICRVLRFHNMSTDEPGRKTNRRVEENFQSDGGSLKERSSTMAREPQSIRTLLVHYLY